MISIRVETEYRSVGRSLSRWGLKREHNAPIATESEIADLVKRLKLIRRSDSSMIAIGVEPEYRSVGRSLSAWGPKGESNAPIAAGSEVTNFLRRRCSCSCSFGVLWNVRVLNCTYQGRRCRVALFGLAVPCWLGLNMFFLRRWCIACRSLNAHQFWSGSPDLSRRLSPAVKPCWSPGWGGVRPNEEEPHFSS
jgi:hypothetical protein